MYETESNASPDLGVQDQHRWRDLDPLVKLGVGLGAVLFCGVILEGLFLVPYALIENGWTPGTK
ncbi:hypothetical protein GCM10009547_28300 [Sporichthya brevicatena]|uniref:Uncharacterized protein n=1 Tax=Sporichthya brevicatena TaxID=171442 RepID=A0ABN1GYF8_9ACTN